MIFRKHLFVNLVRRLHSLVNSFCDYAPI